MGYHKRQIIKGELGKVSKIREELEELEDAIEQDNKILALCELADLYGAIEHVLLGQFTDLTMEDLKVMSRATSEAFQDGTRK